MLHNNNRIELWDEGLRLLFLESSKEDLPSLLEKSMEAVLSSDSIASMPEAMSQQLIQQLTVVMETQSLGQLLTEALGRRSTSQNAVISQAALPVDVINDLMADAIYTNNVPIVLFKNLLSALNISYQEAEKAIRKTFNMLRNQVIISPFGALNPAFKRSNQNHSLRDAHAQSISKGNGRELYQNEEAISRYLGRLEELMN